MRRLFPLLSLLLAGSPLSCGEPQPGPAARWDSSAGAARIRPAPEALDSPTLGCGEAARDRIGVELCAGPSGAPAGFSLQWIDAADEAAWGWDSAGPSFCEAGLSGNASGHAFSLGAGACLALDLGALPLSTPGASSSCGALACGTSYLVRAFAHAEGGQDGLRRSAWSVQQASCETSGCGFADGEYCSFGQGGYGNRGLPHQLLAAAFDDLELESSGELRVCSGGPYPLVFTSALAIQEFLPAGATPGQLTGPMVDPIGDTPAGVFAGQVTALRANVDLSAAGALPASGGELGELELCDLGGTGWAALEGQTIAKVLAAAEEHLTGRPLYAPYDGASTSEANDLVDLLNHSFEEGFIDPAGDEQPCGRPSEFARLHLCRP